MINLKKNKYIFILVIALCIIIIFFHKAYSQEEDRQKIKVGVFILEPYAYLNSKGEPDGYYIEVFDLISKKINIDPEYKFIELKDWLLKLKNKEVDIILGASITDERKVDFIFNKNSIALERMALYTNKNNIDLSNFQNLNGLKYGYVEGGANAVWVFNFFKSIDVEVEPIAASNYHEVESLMDQDKIDLMMGSKFINSKYKKIYEFIGDQVYIASNKENQVLLNKIDGAIDSYKEESNNKIDNLYKKYFDAEKKEIGLLRGLIIFIIILILAIYNIPKLRRLFIKEKIKERLRENRYLLYYQPIYNPLEESIVGFEALLRLKDKNGKLISPGEFIPEIEKNNMLFDVTIWIIEKVCNIYNEVKEYNSLRDRDFYISINLSIDEIQNNKFVEKAIDLLKASKLKDNSICLEIVERVGISDLDKIINNINKLKKAGFKIAIDDFGVEYSNLDILEKLDVDIIKVDKEFVDGLGKDLIKDETILFILRVAKAENKFVILEGVEEESQDKRIKKFNNKELFVQGYFYNKPMPIESIKDL